MVRSRLASLTDLDDDRVADICIGVTQGPGRRFRLLQRMRATRREAVRLAGRTASHLAEATSERVLDPQQRPSAIRVSEDPATPWIWLDYDVGVMGEGRPRASRALRLTLLAR
ncbi:MAG: hypothetical protein RMK29_16430 [Myxococcales bacterium]|nr:hypothetical protein [Myxococcota bacterium]MDW8283300.1 hypothetical protein [Myxococcales bacterium]